MSASVFAFPGRSKGPMPWTNDELAELYRVVDLLSRAGLSVSTDMGLSDEGDPWFVFCRVDNEEVIAHFARIDGVFVAASIAVDETFRGANFRQIVDRMVSSQPLVMPRPNAGSKLFVHPAVLLTAFVATALAHSEKTQALDWLRAVEAQWDHGKAAILGHVKTGWLDTLQTILKMPLHDHKVALDSSKETQALSLVSLIAIAMSALQPIVEKISVIAQFVADELPGHASPGQAQSSHAAQLALDDSSGAGIGQAGHGGESGNVHHSSAEDSPQAHKLIAAAVPSDAGSDGQKAVIDPSAHAAASVPTVQKVALYADDAGHAPAAPIEVQPEAVGALLVMQQKVAAMVAASPVESIVITTESANTPPIVIGAEDVTLQARQVLSINGKSDSVSTDSGASSTPSGGDASHAAGADNSGSATLLAGGSGGTVSSAPAAAVVVPQNQVIDDVNTPFATVIQTISTFVNAAAHLANDAVSLTGNATLQNELASFFGNGNSSLKVVFFESNTSEPDAFLFSPGVVFVNEKVISPSLSLANEGGTLTLQVDTHGGTVTLVGVATVTEHTVVSV